MQNFKIPKASEVLPNDPDALILARQAYDLLGVSRTGNTVERMKKFDIPIVALVGKRTYLVRLGDVMKVVKKREREAQARVQVAKPVPRVAPVTENHNSVTNPEFIVRARTAMITKFLAEDDNPLTKELKEINAKLDRLLKLWEPQ